MPFRFVVWESVPDDAQLGVFSMGKLVENRLNAIVQFGLLII
jgi:hypothetical protein